MSEPSGLARWKTPKVRHDKGTPWSSKVGIMDAMHAAAASGEVTQREFAVAWDVTVDALRRFAQRQGIKWMPVCRPSTRPTQPSASMPSVRAQEHAAVMRALSLLAAPIHARRAAGGRVERPRLERSRAGLRS